MSDHLLNHHQFYDHHQNHHHFHVVRDDSDGVEYRHLIMQCQYRLLIGQAI